MIIADDNKKGTDRTKKYLLQSTHEGVILADTFIFRMKQCKPDFVPASGDKVRLFLRC